MSRGFAVEGVRSLRVEQLLAKEKTAKMRGLARKKRYVRKRWFLRNIDFECQLYRGLSLFPRTKIMTCAEMGEANRKFVQNHINSMDDEGNTNKLLWVYKIVDINKFKKSLSSYVNSF